MTENVAFFDFDKTITKKDTLKPLALYISRIKNNPISFYIFLFYCLCFKLRIIPNRKLKELFLKLFFDGYSVDRLKDLIFKFEEDFIKMNLNQNIFTEFVNYVRNGSSVFIVSSNLRIFLENLTILKDANIIATEVEYNKINNTYKLRGDICSGLEKINRLKQMFGYQIFEKAIFYGDKEDEMLLKIFNKSITV